MEVMQDASPHRSPQIIDDTAQRTAIDALESTRDHKIVRIDKSCIYCMLHILWSIGFSREIIDSHRSRSRNTEYVHMYVVSLRYKVLQSSYLFDGQTKQ